MHGEIRSENEVIQLGALCVQRFDRSRSWDLRPSNNNWSIFRIWGKYVSEMDEVTANKHRTPAIVKCTIICVARWKKNIRHQLFCLHTAWPNPNAMSSRMQPKLKKIRPTKPPYNFKGFRLRHEILPTVWFRPGKGSIKRRKACAEVWWGSSASMRCRHSVWIYSLWTRRSEEL